MHLTLDLFFRCVQAKDFHTTVFFSFYIRTGTALYLERFVSLARTWKMDKMAEGQQGSLPFRFTGSDGIPLHSFHDGSSPVHDERLLTGFLAAMNGLLGLSAGHLMELPQNYTLRQLPSGAFALYGHPR